MAGKGKTTAAFRAWLGWHRGQRGGRFYVRADQEGTENPRRYYGKRGEAAERGDKKKPTAAQPKRKPAQLNFAKAMEKVRDPGTDFATVERGLRDWFKTLPTDELRAELKKHGLNPPRGRAAMENHAVGFVGHLSGTAQHAAIIADAPAKKPAPRRGTWAHAGVQDRTVRKSLFKAGVRAADLAAMSKSPRWSAWAEQLAAKIADGTLSPKDAAKSVRMFRYWHENLPGDSNAAPEVFAAAQAMAADKPAKTSKAAKPPSPAMKRKIAKAAVEVGQKAGGTASEKAAIAKTAAWALEDKRKHGTNKGMLDRFLAWAGKAARGVIKAISRGFKALWSMVQKPLSTSTGRLAARMLATLMLATLAFGVMRESPKPPALEDSHKPTETQVETEPAETDREVDKAQLIKDIQHFQKKADRYDARIQEEYNRPVPPGLEESFRQDYEKMQQDTIDKLFQQRNSALSEVQRLQQQLQGAQHVAGQR